MMAITFSLNQEGAEFKVKVTDCTNDTPIDKNDISSQKIVFYKPDGTMVSASSPDAVETGQRAYRAAFPATLKELPGRPSEKIIDVEHEPRSSGRAYHAR